MQANDYLGTLEVSSLAMNPPAQRQELAKRRKRCQVTIQGPRSQTYQVVSLLTPVL